MYGIYPIAIAIRPLQCVLLVIGSGMRWKLREPINETAVLFATDDKNGNGVWAACTFCYS
ncbi:hypothetical protein CH063_13126 [Colletotrichum higginsianum]|uniref:Uncharacterized protein n=1 Tax=Colletotrichum higginsianum (strain IMI 349063) TaxID=759273 RepID=H1VT56_COLHI|nr:hypothetical protein CH063_13126 [Colletotrichum higginsianum]